MGGEERSRRQREKKNMRCLRAREGAYPRLEEAQGNGASPKAIETRTREEKSFSAGRVTADGQSCEVACASKER